MVTMSDVARVAGVSAMTVSNVLNDRRGATEATRSRVLAAVSSLGYEMNLTARQLRVGRTDTIALMLPNIGGAYFSELATRVTALGRKRGFHVVVETTGASEESELTAIQASRLRFYDGVIMYLIRIDQEVLSELEFDVPVVLLGERAEPARFDHVMMDNTRGAALAARRLVELGARRIALVGGEPNHGAPSMATLRTDGYRMALAEAGIPFDASLIVAGQQYGMSDGYEAVSSLIASGCEFDAVFALTDPAAQGAIRALVDHDLTVPGDVQVVGFDNTPETDYSVPRLTSVNPGTEAIAESVLNLLIDRILDCDESPPRTETPSKAVLVERESTRS